MSGPDDVTSAYVADAPHPWTYHDPGGTDAPGRITDDSGDEVSIGRAWREVQRLRAENAALREVVREADQARQRRGASDSWRWRDYNAARNRQAAHIAPSPDHGTAG